MFFCVVFFFPNSPPNAGFLVSQLPLEPCQEWGLPNFSVLRNCADSHPQYFWSSFRCGPCLVCGWTRLTMKHRPMKMLKSASVYPLGCPRVPPSRSRSSNTWPQPSDLLFSGRRGVPAPWAESSHPAVAPLVSHRAAHALCKARILNSTPCSRVL